MYHDTALRYNTTMCSVRKVTPVFSPFSERKEEDSNITTVRPPIRTLSYIRSDSAPLRVTTQPYHRIERASITVSQESTLINIKAHGNRVSREREWADGGGSDEWVNEVVEESRLQELSHWTKVKRTDFRAVPNHSKMKLTDYLRLALAVKSVHLLPALAALSYRTPSLPSNISVSKR
ncbi:hypothetical protein EVAR_96171_1 [Eumeta japonica]|uniref:Uncharacterized protein n=1 Tax=Eumeta variegata TaxID=151549 RepID=A0A4C1VJ06_EUMVA|nr:hypothetical protein EVAR_96171_1 [Eumeta japonica]